MNWRIFLLTGLFLCLSALNAFSQKDIQWDIKTGNEVAKQVEKKIGLIHLPEAEKTLKAVGGNLVEQLTANPYSFSFEIIDQPEPNAFALPGGHVYVSRGLIALINNEDELAGVLGHEISHVVLRHSAKQQKKSILPSILAIPGVLLGSTIGGSLGDKVAAPLLGAGRLFLASYSRKQESEADVSGISLAAKAGYDPSALGIILHRIELSLESENGKSAKFSLFNDHPMTPERMSSIESMSKTIMVSSGNHLYEKAKFLESFNHLLFGPNPAMGVFNKNIFLHPHLDIYWELPEGWSYANESSAAGAFHEKSQILLTIAGKDRQLDTLINNFVNGYYAKTRREPLSDSKIKISERNGSELIEPASQKDQVIYTVWFKKDKLTYLILAVGDKSDIEIFRQCSQTLRDLTPSDYPLITFGELFTKTALPGESISNLNERTGNSASSKVSSIMNGIPEDWKFTGGEPVKTVTRERYQP